MRSHSRRIAIPPVEVSPWIPLILLLLVALGTPGVSRGSTQQDDSWYSNPCQHDSTDSFEWTRHDLRGITIRVPRDIRRVPYPDPNELRFQKGPARMRLRLHNDASQLFAQYEKGERGVLYCATDVAGRLAEVIRFTGPPTTGYSVTVGFAVRWPDADRGEWLTAVITATSMADATALRQTLFTIVFPK